jgi:hypothetical protein
MESVKRSRTESIIAILDQMIGVHGTEHGAPPPPAEHPLAWSAATRLAFIGKRGRTVDANGTIDSSAWTWQTLSPTGEAVGGLEDYEVETDASRYPAGAANRATILSRLLHPDDIFLGSTTAGTIDAPALAGVPRRWLGVLGAPMGSEAEPTAVVTCADGRKRWIHPVPSWGTRWRKIPRPVQPVTSARLAQPPYDYAAYAGNPTVSWKYADQECLVQGWNDTASAKLVAWLAGSGGMLDELRSLGAVYQPADDTQLTSGSRFWSDDAGTAAYEPGRLRSSLDGSGPWRICRLRHLAFYDAWGGAILYYTAADGTPCFMSAGKDRSFRIDPGANRTIDTDLTGAAFLDGGTLAGDDRDATIDNIPFRR